MAGYESTPGDQNCGVDIDECASSPCVNGATCTDSITDASIPNNHYRCTCAAGFTDGVCLYSYISEYTAECTVSTSLFSVAYSGNCDIDVDECASAPCANGATCHDSLDDASIPVHTYQCVCLSGFANGACGYTDYISEYTAQCTVPNSGANAFSGNCDVDVDECDSSPCANGATCTDSADNSAGIPVHAYKCTCAAGYANGDCAYTTIAAYTTQCQVLLNGNCNVDVDECLSNPCQNSATCTDSTSQPVSYTHLTLPTTPYV